MADAQGGAEAGTYVGVCGVRADDKIRSASDQHMHLQVLHVIWQSRIKSPTDQWHLPPLYATIFAVDW